MCDTSLATEIFTGTTSRIFAKNSDREPNEAQAILHIPRVSYPLGTILKTTFITIPQVRETNEVFLSKPFQMWGAEMGVNEFGVAIGNEAVFTNIKKMKSNNGLTGMDLIRLGLERSKSAKEALDLITTLLENYGQDACGGYEDHNFFYHNSFIISDKSAGYVLETADRFWVAKKIEKFYAISNGLTIDSDYDFASNNLEKYISKKVKGKASQSFSFRETFSDIFYTRMSKCKTRKALHESRSTDIKTKTNSYTVPNAVSVLGSHNIPNDNFDVSKSNMGSLCLHATGPLTPSNTNGSLIVQWNTSPESTIPFQIWYTGTSSPCLSVFKPFFFGTKNLQSHPLLLPGKHVDQSLWWSHENIARHANFDYQSVRSILLQETSRLSTKIQLSILHSMSDQKKSEIQIDALDEHLDLITKINAEIKENQIGRSKWTSPLFQLFWSIQNQKVGIKT